MKNKKLTREMARKAYKDADLAFFPLTFQRMANLRDFINKQLRKSNVMEGTWVADHPNKIKIEDNQCFIRCSSYYFDNRELVSFENNGFVGFAGWADDKNIQYILKGFMKWVKYEEEIAELN